MIKLTAIAISTSDHIAWTFKGYPILTKFTQFNFQFERVKAL